MQDACGAHEFAVPSAKLPPELPEHRARLMELHLRLDAIDIPNRIANITVDEFLPNWKEVQHGYLTLRRNQDGTVSYTLAAGTGGVAPSLNEAIAEMQKLVEKHLGPLANPVEFAPDGLDRMGLWAVVGVDPGLPQA